MTATDKNVLALAKSKSNHEYAYAFGFVWAYLTREQKENLDKIAMEILAEMESN